MSSTSYNNQTEDRAARGPIRAASGLIGLLAACVALVASANAIADDEHTIPRARISYVVHERYFPNAVDRSEWTRRNLTTEDFRHLEVGTAEAWEFWKGVEDVPDPSIHLGPTTEKKNIYDLGWTWEMKGGTSSSVKVEAEFSCASWVERYVPFMMCSRDNVRINDARLR